MKDTAIRVIGLTGGVATGKSSVARFFSERGVRVIDADQLSREAVLPGTSALARIVEEFGVSVLLPDGSLDRKKLRELVFSDSNRRNALESILHPEIKRLADARISEAAAEGNEVVIYMAPLLIEAGATDRVDEIWVVTVTPELQIERLMSRDNMTSEEAMSIIESQMPLAEKERHARIVIDNSGTFANTALLLEKIMKEEIDGNNGQK